MSDYKQTRDAAGNVTSQYGQMLRNLDDDLVDRLNDRRVCSPAQNSCRNDHVLNQAEARIQELEAKLAKAVKLAEEAFDFNIEDAGPRAWHAINDRIEELKGQDDE